VIFAFAKSPDDNLASLAKEIDKVVAAHADKKLAAVINFTGAPTDENKQKVAEFAKKNNIEHTALVLTQQANNFKVDPEADVTVMHYRVGQVRFNYSTSDGVDEEAIEKIISGVDAILQ
jgi:hypothetical protein